jgi:hypothetical protein
VTAPVLQAANLHVRLGRRAVLAGIDVAIAPGHGRRTAARDAG